MTVAEGFNIVHQENPLGCRNVQTSGTLVGLIIHLPLREL